MPPHPPPCVVRISRVDPRENNGWCWVADAPTLPLQCKGYGNTAHDAELVLMRGIKRLIIEELQRQCR